MSQDKRKPPHHRTGQFQNNYLEFQPRSLAEVLRWKWEAGRAGEPKPPSTPIPSVSPDLKFIHANAEAASQQPAVTWIGHATVLAQIGGLNVLTDPIFSARASPVQFIGPKRHQAPGVALADLPSIDLVLVSHNHYDHMDEGSLCALAKQPGGGPWFVVPLGLAAWFQRRGIERVIELDWWQCHEIQTALGAVEVVLLPAQHWSARGLGDRMKTLWGGFAVIAPDCHLFYAGDTAYSRDFTDIREHFAGRQTGAQGGGFDIALLPIGAYEPRWFMSTQHVNVEEALKIHQDLGAKRSLGVHWGTFELTNEPLDEPPRQLAAQREALGIAAQDFFTLGIGQTQVLTPRRAQR